jgi:site-specific DNA recombinase
VAEIKPLRCAIYTRVSTDSGLEQEFNSLDAQREAAEAYIKSQAHEGWRLIRQGYDDGGYSGGTLERPALKQLLQDVRDKTVDIIVVYKVDRLTRSLADFAKLVELFDQNSASFVSVTQSFNTTTSMGRLTLNVLLSFAQFEREVTAERIRDKIAASKKKGIWMGGIPPLGYRVQDRKLLIDPVEAKTVKMIFERYLELGSTLPLLEELGRAGVRTRKRTLSNGKSVGGIPFTRGPLHHLLGNRTYIGELNHRKASYPGEHEAVVDRETFEAVQAQSKRNVQTFRNTRTASEALLMGKLFDDRGNLMTPTHSSKNGVRYRYYTCRLLIEGRRSEAGKITTVSAVAIERAVVAALRSSERVSAETNSSSSLQDGELIKGCLARVMIHTGRLQIFMNSGEEPAHIEVPWTRPASRPKREILLPHVDTRRDGRPIKTEIRASVVKAVSQGRRWLNELISDPKLTIDALAEREDRSKRSVNMLLSLNFLAPEIVRALIAGKLPRGIGITKLVDLPSSWEKQREDLGLTRIGAAVSAAASG